MIYNQSLHEKKGKNESLCWIFTNLPSFTKHFNNLSPLIPKLPTVDQSAPTKKLKINHGESEILEQFTPSRAPTTDLAYLFNVNYKVFVII